MSRGGESAHVTTLARQHGRRHLDNGIFSASQARRKVGKMWRKHYLGTCCLKLKSACHHCVLVRLLAWIGFRHPGMCSSA